MKRTIKCGRYQAFTSHGQAYLDQMPGGLYGWRLVASWGPPWLPFSQRYGYKPGPRVGHIGKAHLCYYPRGWAGHSA